MRYATSRSSRRDEAATRLRRFLERHGRPRLEMSGMLAVAALAGFLTSALLLHLGLTSMALRWSVAVFAGYGAFLLLLRRWVARRIAASESRWLDGTDGMDVTLDGALHTTPASPSIGGEFGGGGAGGAFDAPEAGPSAPVRELAAAAGETSPCGGIVTDGTPASGAALREVSSPVAEAAGDALGGADESLPLVVVLAMIAAVGASVAALVLAIWSAPVLLAEVLLDALVAGAVIRGLGRVDPGSWMTSALRRTWKRAVGLAIALAASGALLQAAAPGADSVAQALALLRGG